MPKRAVAEERRNTSRPRFRDVVRAHQRDVQASQGSEDAAERDRALQRRLSGYDVEHLEKFFGKRPLADITESLVVKYAIRRQGQGAAIATVNGELKTLWRLSRFAADTLGLAWRPRIEFLRELVSPAPRRTFWERVDGRLFPRHPVLLPAALARAAKPVPQPRGPKPAITAEQFRQQYDLVRNEGARRERSDQKWAAVLTRELKLPQPLSHDQVARARRKAGIPPAHPAPPKTGIPRATRNAG